MNRKRFYPIIKMGQPVEKVWVLPNWHYSKADAIRQADDVARRFKLRIPIKPSAAGLYITQEKLRQGKWTKINL